MRKDLFHELVESVQQMTAIEAGRLKPGRVTRLGDLVEEGHPHVCGAPRAVFNLSQAQFARLLGISVSTCKLGAKATPSEGPAKAPATRRSRAP